MLLFFILFIEYKKGLCQGDFEATHLNDFKALYFYFHFCELNNKPVIDAVLVVDVEQFVFNPGNLFGGLSPSFSLQRVLPVDRC